LNALEAAIFGAMARAEAVDGRVPPAGSNQRSPAKNRTNALTVECTHRIRAGTARYSDVKAGIMTMPNHIPRSQRSSEYVSRPAGWFYFSGLGSLERERRNKRASEMSFGRGLTAPELRDSPPAEGGRYVGTSPPAIPYPQTPQVIDHVWGTEVVKRPKRRFRERYED
jgi:hypothetical protein